MPTQLKPLVQFDAAYYLYPTSISRGFWARCLLEEGLSTDQKEDRERWLKKVQSESRSEFHKIVIERFADAADQEAIRSALLEHGIFAERFFHRSLRERIARQYAKSAISLKDLQGLITSASGYELRLYNKSDAIFHIADHLFEQNLLDALSYHQVYYQALTWFEEFSKARTCILCGSTFRVIDLPDWVYFGSNGFKRCCFGCRIVEAPKKNDLGDLVPAFIRVCGFIPNSDANAINFAFTSRLPASEWTKVILAYARMGGIDHAKKKFGSWFTALAKTGALPNGVIATARGIRCLAKDGHICHSLDEQRIDDWLHVHDLDHEREPNYPQHPSFNLAGKRRADWKVRETFVEYFGLLGDPEYEKKMDEKILLAQESNTMLIAIYPADIEKLDERLGNLLH